MKSSISSDYCEVCTIPYNYILHFENLESEERHLINILNADNVLETRYENVYHRDGLTDQELINKYFLLLDQSDVEQLAIIYQDDFNNFGYDAVSFYQR